MKQTWKTLNKKIEYTNPYWKVRKDKVIDPGGTLTYYYQILRNDFVIVIPITNDKKHTYLIRQWRYPIRKNSWEYSAGSIDDGETPLQAAKRELLEETGISAKKWKKIKYSKSNNGLMAQGFNIYACFDLHIGEPNYEPGEADMILKKYSFKEVEKMIDKGLIFEAPTITAMYFIKKYLKL